MAESKPEHAASPSEKDVKAPDMLDRAEKSPHHHKETHGRSDDIDKDTPADEVKGPNLFQRVKEEVEAIVEATHPQKKSSSD